jgi:hypothetical protein
MGQFASGHPDASANDGRMQEKRRPRSDERKSTGCKICSKEHQVADCEEFLAMGLDERVDTCKRNVFQVLGRYNAQLCLLQSQDEM